LVRRLLRSLQKQAPLFDVRSRTYSGPPFYSPYSPRLLLQTSRSMFLRSKPSSRVELQVKVAYAFSPLFSYILTEFHLAVVMSLEVPLPAFFQHLTSLYPLYLTRHPGPTSNSSSPKYQSLHSLTICSSDPSRPTLTPRYSSRSRRRRAVSYEARERSLFFFFSPFPPLPFFFFLDSSPLFVCARRRAAGSRSC